MIALWACVQRRDTFELADINANGDTVIQHLSLFLVVRASTPMQPFETGMRARAAKLLPGPTPKGGTARTCPSLAVNRKAGANNSILPTHKGG